MTVPKDYRHASEDFLRFLEAVKSASGLWSTHVAFTMAQGVFQVFRRRLTTAEAIHFANELPAALRALFVAEWDINEPRATFDAMQAMNQEVKALRPHHNFATDTAIEDVAQALRTVCGEQALSALLSGLPEDARRFWFAGAQ